MMNTDQEARERYPLSPNDELRIVSMTREALVLQLRSAYNAGAAAALNEGTRS